MISNKFLQQLLNTTQCAIDGYRTFDLNKKYHLQLTECYGNKR